MKDEQFLKDLNRFLGKAGVATYAGGGAETASERLGFHELEDSDGLWYYRDSYTGWFRSWGTELVRHDGRPVWNALYGGGMEPEYWNDVEFTRITFDFLKKALSAGEKQESFQPRGPKRFYDGDWQDWWYEADWVGDITSFVGHERILCRLHTAPIGRYPSHKVVFTHDFMGGLIISKESRNE
ncbi:MAG: DUF5680 domain-containing protein [bacterium]|nr:DUF5680 domain-containing protein [bacterium]MDZ4299565.1 DUF5680 domain-containing protein [Candidatus Sungbacteria bacterium]